MKSSRLAIFFLPCVLSTLVGCGSEASREEPADDKVLELYSWWTNPGETDALDALLGMYEDEYPQTSVVRATVTGNVSAREQLRSRMIGGTPPDTFQALGGWDLMQWVLFNGSDNADSKMNSVSFLMEENHWADIIPESVRNSVSYNGETYGIPIGIHRYNVLYYNKRVLDEHQLEAPTSWAEFYEVADVLQADGVTPLALGNKLGWPLALVAWDGILVAQAGADFHDSYLTGKEAADDQRIVDMLNETVKVLGYTNSDRDVLTWDEAANMVVDGTAAMTIMGDWAKGFFLSHGMVPQEDFDHAPTPGTDGVFVYLVDSFGLPKGATNETATINFLNMIGSSEAQDMFNPIKGSTPPRTDADLSKYDVLATETIQDFQQNRLSMGREVIVSSPEFNSEFVDTMQQFGSDLRVDVVVNMLKNRYDLLSGE